MYVCRVMCSRLSETACNFADMIAGSLAAKGIANIQGPFAEENLLHALCFVTSSASTRQHLCLERP